MRGSSVFIITTVLMYNMTFGGGRFCRTENLAFDRTDSGGATKRQKKIGARNERYDFDISNDAHV